MTHFFYYLASRACFSGRFIPSYVTKNVTCQELKTPVKAERARSAFNQKNRTGSYVLLRVSPIYYLRYRPLLNRHQLFNFVVHYDDFTFSAHCAYAFVNKATFMI